MCREGCRIGCPLDEWIDTKTGLFQKSDDDYDKKNIKDLEQKLGKCIWELYWSFLEIFDCGKTNEFLDYYLGPGCHRTGLDFDFSGIRIVLSEDIKYIKRVVHQGIGSSEDDAKRKYPRHFNPEESSDFQESDESVSRDDPVKISFLKLGEFKASVSGNPKKIGTITLYTKAISEFCNKNSIDYKTSFWSTFTHEAFHAFHFMLFKKSDRQMRWNAGSTKKNRDIVKESLADAFEYLFLDAYEGECFAKAEANKLKDYLEYTWRSYDVGDWPYSGAISITGAKSGTVHSPYKLFCNLLHKSLYVWKTAADIITTGYYLADPEIKKYYNNP